MTRALIGTIGGAGETITQSRLRSASTSLTTSISANITASPLTLGAGVWLISAMIGFAPSGATMTFVQAAISTVSATLPSNDVIAVPTGNQIRTIMPLNLTGLGTDISLTLPPISVVLTGSSAFYLVGQAGFSAGTVGGYGAIWAVKQ